MSLEQELFKRSGSKCELCSCSNDLEIYKIPDSPATVNNAILICENCISQIENPEKVEPNHWRCLNDSMWNTEPGVQVMAWRMLYRLRAEGWPQDLLDMMYMEEEVKNWAKAGVATETTSSALVHKDSNGATIEAGDNVVLIKDLNVKGSSMIAKRGTAVRRVSLVHDNAEQIEGKVEGQQIVILTKFVKKI